MESIDNNAYQADALDEPVVAIVGDATTPDFYAQVKVEKWNNEANFSLRYDQPVVDHAVDADGVVEAVHEDSTSRIYVTQAPTVVPVTRVRRVANNLRWQGVEATAEYEMFNQIGTPGTMLLAHYVVEEPTLAVFDLMPADMHLDVDADGYAKDFDYPDKAAYQPADIPMPSYDRIKLVRYFTPYTPVVNPYYMDSGIHNIDIQWHGSKCDGVHEALLSAIETVCAAHGIVTRRHETRTKLYFQHGDRWVKFYSGQGEDGGLYAYLNIASSYNKAYDFYRPDVEKDVRDQYAYGLAFAYDVGHEIVADIMDVFASSLGVELVDEPYDAVETARWQAAATLHDSVAWATIGERDDANWYRRTAKDGIELEVIFAEKPASNLVPFTGNVPKNVRAFVQTAIDPMEQLSTGSRRQPDVAGSLAIYHQDKKHNDYKTGKVAHIYRPVAHDASGLSVFCDFAELDGLDDGAEYDLAQGLTVRVPQAFLDVAVFPVTVDPTVGYSTAGASSTSIQNTIIGTAVTPASTGWLLGLRAYLDNSGNTSTEFEYAVYDAQGSFNLQTQTANSTTVTVAAWTGLLFPRPWELTGSRNFIFAAWGTAVSGGYGATATVLAYDSTSGKTSYSLSKTYASSTWPSTLSGASTTSNREYSIYGVFGYAFPVMVGSSASLAAATGARYTLLTSTNDSVWANTIATAEGLHTDPFVFGDFSISLAAAAGSGITRTMGPYINGVASSVSVALANTTSGQDATDAAFSVANDRIPIGNTVAGGTPAASTPNRWRLQMIGASQPMCGRLSGSTTATRYSGIQDDSGTTGATTIEQVVPEAGTFKTFRARLDTAITSGSYALTLVKNGVDTAATITLDSTNQEAGYTATTVTVAAGDKLYWKCVPSTPSNARTILTACLYDSDTAGNGLLLSNNNVSASNSATVYNNWYGSGAWNATESNVQALAEHIQITKVYVLLSASPGTGKNRVVAIRQNGVSTVASVTIADAATTGTWTGTLNIARDDLINIIQTPSGTPTASTVKVGIVYNYGLPWVAQTRWM